MVYFLEWNGDDDPSGDWDGDDIDPTPSAPSDPLDEDRITSGSLDDHSNGSLVEPSSGEDYSDSGTAKDPVITENQLFQSSETDTEKPEEMIAPEGTGAETQAQQEEQPLDTSDHSSDPLVITPRSTTDPDVITKDHLANCRGLSIQQPFATLIARGEKRFETRGQKTNYRGLILIHAPQKIDKASFKQIVREQDDPAEFPTSRVLAVAELTDCIFMDESFINEQPDQELLHGCWEPGRYAWKLQNIRPLNQTVTGVGALGLGLWKPNDLLIDRLEGMELRDRVDDPNNPSTERWECVQKCLIQLANYPDIQEEVLAAFTTVMSQRQKDEVMRRITSIADTDEAPGVEPVTDTDEAPGAEPVTDTDNEAPGAETVTTPDIFDQIEVGDRVCRSRENGDLGTTGIVTKKILSPRQIEIRFPDSVGSSKLRTATPEELEALRIKILCHLRTGTRIKFGSWTGKLSSKCKNGKWYVFWDGFPGKGIRKKYGEPPKKAIAPQDLEVIDES